MLRGIQFDNSFYVANIIINNNLRPDFSFPITGELQEFKRLIESRIDRYSSKIFAFEHPNALYPIYVACFFGSTKTVRYLVETKFYPNKEKILQKCRILACLTGKLRILDILISENERNTDFAQLLDIARFKKVNSITEFLLSKMQEIPGIPKDANIESKKSSITDISIQNDDHETLLGLVINEKLEKIIGYDSISLRSIIFRCIEFDSSECFATCIQKVYSHFYDSDFRRNGTIIINQCILRDAEKCMKIYIDTFAYDFCGDNSLEALFFSNYCEIGKIEKKCAVLLLRSPLCLDFTVNGISLYEKIVKSGIRHEFTRLITEFNMEHNYEI